MKCQIYHRENATVEITYNGDKFIMCNQAAIEFWEQWKSHVNSNLATFSIKKL